MEPIKSLHIGDTLPELTLKAFYQGDEKTLQTADYAGKWKIFFFYPADFTFVCPTELEELAMMYADFQKESLQTSQTTLSSLLKDTRLSRDLRSDIALTNRLLTVLANETIQTRALLLQTLELKSAHYSQRLPISLEAQAQVSSSSPLRQNFGRKDNHG